MTLRKRQRVDSTSVKDEDEPELVLTHHPDLWFEDGNVVLIAQDTAFKVYRGVLARHSTVLEQRLADATAAPTAAHSTTYAQCPALHIEETPFDVEKMLDWMFRAIGPAPASTQVTLKAVVAYLHMSTAFTIPKLRDEAVSRLSKCYPSTLQQYDIIGNRSSPNRPIQWTKDQDVAVAALASWEKLHALLPVAIYECCRTESDLFLERLDLFRSRGAVDTALLENESWILRKYVRGRPKLVDGKLNKVYGFLKGAPSEQCQSKRKCEAVLKAKTQLPSKQGSNVAHPLLNNADKVFEASFKDACTSCVDFWKSQFRQARLDVFNELPNYFDLAAAVNNQNGGPEGMDE